MEIYQERKSRSVTRVCVTSKVEGEGRGVEMMMKGEMGVVVKMWWLVRRGR